MHPHPHLYGPLPGFDVLLSLLDAKLHVADVLAEFKMFVAVKCSVLKMNITDENA